MYECESRSHDRGRETGLPDADERVDGRDGCEVDVEGRSWSILWVLMQQRENIKSSTGFAVL